MDPCRYALLALTLTVSIALSGASPLHSAVPLPPAVDAPSSQVTVRDASHAQEERVDAAVASFDAVGLSLPDSVVTFVNSAASCRDNDGWFEPGAVARITICSDLAYVVTHELAHAWLEVNLDDHARERYLAARGLPTWNDHGLPWEARGVEDAAFVIQQNLMIDRIVSCNDLWLGRAAAFELLTGARSPLQLEPCPER